MTLQTWLRGQPLWVKFQELNREGWGNALRRRSVQRRILGTPPVRTARPGPGDRVEVRALTWRRDWIDLVWALKSFYHFAAVDYPLHVHDGGLEPAHVEQIRRHFPDATIHGIADADRAVEPRLPGRCREYRRANVSTRKLFDFFATSSAEYVISIDSDIVFFRRPDALIVPPEGLGVNRYNEDTAYWYSLPLDELEAAFGVRPPPRINSGLSVVRRETIDFARIDGWLAHPGLFADKWVTEQTLHALCSTVAGVELLPPAYAVGTAAGVDDDAVCKHYPSPPRPLLYAEGMPRLIRAGFLEALR